MYHIVPRNDGYHYLALDENNQFVLQHKAKSNPAVTPFEFSNLDSAMTFLADYNLIEEYKPEEFWR